VPYNPQVSKAYWLLISATLCLGFACEKNSPKTDNGALAVEHGSGSAGVAPDTGPVDTTPLSGISTEKLGDDKKTVFFRLVNSLSSPCGKAESLRKSFTTDTSCKRAPYAVRYVMALVEDEANETQARDEYEKKYKQGVPDVKLDVAKHPHDGPEDAPIKIYEFFDYECPHCKAFKPALEQVMKDEAGKVCEYYMMFPLEKHEGSKSAAQAALAAQAQGKFKEMHDILFEKSPDHDHGHVTDYAKGMGLDMTKFEADYTASEQPVTADIAQGEKAGVDSTPTLFLNNRKYDGPMHPKYIEMWIEEELGVNR
jgi:protein-disulfide isomerase